MNENVMKDFGGWAKTFKVTFNLSWIHNREWRSGIIFDKQDPARVRECIFFELQISNLLTLSE